MSTLIQSLRLEDCIDDNNNESEKLNGTKSLFKFKVNFMHCIKFLIIFYSL